MILKGYLLSIVYALLCLAVAFAIYKLGAPKKITRKIVHILVGFEWAILYHYIGATVHFLLVCILFLLILMVSYRKNLMPMISSDGDNAPGTVYYAVAMALMATAMLFVPKMILPFGLGVFCTSFGDGLAGVVGQIIHSPKNIKIYNNKTICGSLTNFAVCLAGGLILNNVFALGLNIYHILTISVFATELEIFTGKGLDNITITLGTSFLTYAFAYCDFVDNIIVPIILTPIIIAFAHKKRALTFDGIIAALILDFAVSLTLGNFGFVILFSFFAIGVIVDKIKNKYKKAGHIIEKRGSCRNWVQVFSNGFAATLCAVLFFITGNRTFLIGFVASLAEALADTSASGIGVIFGRSYDICGFRPCEPGLSGGVSLYGTLSSLVGSAVISFIAYAFGMISICETLIILLAGFVGALFDSVLGSLAQVKYKCAVCGSVTEKDVHCEQKTIYYKGISFVNNDVVNFLGTIFSALIAAIIVNTI